MNNFKKHIIYFLLSALFCFKFCGCLEAPTTPPYGGVSGTGYDDNGLPLESFNINIWSYYSIPSMNGNFYFGYIPGPYTTLLTSMVNYGGEYSILYGEVNLQQLYPVSLEFQSEHHGEPSLVITFPKTDPGRRIITKFISNEAFYQGYYSGTAFDTSFSTTVIFPFTNSSITGKLLFLEVTVNGNSMIFNKYGIKDLTIYHDIKQEVNFLPEDLNTNVASSEVSYNITPPAGENTLYTSASLCFPGMNSNSDIQLYSFNYTLSGSFSMPLLEGLNCDVKITSGTYRWSKWMHVPLGGSAEIIHDSKISLSQPEEGQQNISDETVFSIIDNDTKGVYAYLFAYSPHEGHENRYYFVTDKKSFKFRDLHSWAFTDYHNRFFSWYVTKYSDFNSLEDFVSSLYMENPKYVSKYVSDFRSFKTAP